MKRETLRRLKRVVAGNGIIERADAADALATDAEVKRLKKALRDAKAALEFGPGATHTDVCRRNVEAFKVILAALKPQVTRERKRR